MSQNQRKLTDDQVRQIRAEAHTASDRVLGDRYGVHRATIDRIVAGFAYADVTPAVEQKARPWRFYGALQPRWGR